MSSPPAKHVLNLSPTATALPPLQPTQHTPTNLPSIQPAAPITEPPDEPHMAQQQQQQPLSPASGHRKRKPEQQLTPDSPEAQATTATAPSTAQPESPQEPKAKKSRTNTPWTPAEELRLKQMRDAGNSWSEIAKTFPLRTEGSVKKHWYKDMHYAEFAEDESAALLAAIKEYEANKWKAIGQKVGKPAKACEQYAKEHFGGKM